MTVKMVKPLRYDMLGERQWEMSSMEKLTLRMNVYYFENLLILHSEVKKVHFFCIIVFFFQKIFFTDLIRGENAEFFEKKKQFFPSKVGARILNFFLFTKIS